MGTQGANKLIEHGVNQVLSGNLGWSSETEEMDQLLNTTNQQTIDLEDGKTHWLPLYPDAPQTLGMFVGGLCVGHVRPMKQGNPIQLWAAVLYKPLSSDALRVARATSQTKAMQVLGQMYAKVLSEEAGG